MVICAYAFDTLNHALTQRPTDCRGPESDKLLLHRTASCRPAKACLHGLVPLGLALRSLSRVDRRSEARATIAEIGRGHFGDARPHASSQAGGDGGAGGSGLDIRRPLDVNIEQVRL